MGTKYKHITLTIMKFSYAALLLLATATISTARKNRGPKGKMIHKMIKADMRQCWRETCKIGKPDEKSTWKTCNKQCQKTGVCPKWKNVPKQCKKCKRGCFKQSIEASAKVEQFSSECREFCDEICWGPNWKTESCTSCVVSNCSEGLFDTEEEIEIEIKS